MRSKLLIPLIALATGIAIAQNTNPQPVAGQTILLRSGGEVVAEVKVVNADKFSLRGRLGTRTTFDTTTRVTEAKGGATVELERKDAPSVIITADEIEIRQEKK